MAGEWIKTRTNLWDDPRVSRICDLTEQPVPMIIGGLYWLWKTADQHTEDGFLNGLSVTAIDRNTGIKGFGAALEVIKWIEVSAEGVNIVRFDEHNGASAKARATTAKRVAKHRSHSEGEGGVTGHLDLGNGDSVTGPLAREDKNKSKNRKNTGNDESKGSGSRGTRLPEDWKPSAEDVEYCKTERPDLLPSKVATNFYDYWIAKAGKDACKVSWSATWRSWVRKEKTENAPRPRAAGNVAQFPTKSVADQNADNTAAAKRLLFGDNPKDDDQGALEHA